MTHAPLARALADGAAQVLAQVVADLPAALVRWRVGPWAAPPLTRDQALERAVGLCGAALLAYAAWAHGAHRATAAQVRGLAMAGAGFLLTAGASAGLRGYDAVGPAVSLAGAALVLRASLLLVRERQAQRARDRE
jgi:hypothetical protein